MLLCSVGLCACTHDFGTFHFDAADGGNKRSSVVRGGSKSDAAALPMSGRAGSGGSSDAGLVGPSDADTHAAAMDASDRRASDAAVRPSADAAADTGVVADTGNGPHDAGVAPDTGMASDAGVRDDAAVEMCSAAWSSTSLPLSACSTCACASCTDPVTACLTVGTALEAQHCTDVFVCAVEHDCKDWACYCTNTKCGAPNASGDGACVAQMEAAAGGKRVQVMAVQTAGDPNEPLVRAMTAIGCVLGLDPHSPGGPKAGQCDATCP
jgi:hypothetical protein